MTEPAAAVTPPPAADPPAAVDPAAVVAPPAGDPAASDPPAAVDNVIPFPKDGVKDGKWEGFNKLGRPEKPDGYEFTPPELPEGATYNKDFEVAARPVLHELGILPWQAQKLMEFVAGHQVKQLEAAQAANKQAGAALDATLAKEWGADGTPTRTVKTDQARRAAAHFGFDAMMLHRLEEHVGSFRMLKAFQEIGAALGEDKLVSGDAGGSGPRDLASVLYGGSPKPK